MNLPITKGEFVKIWNEIFTEMDDMIALAKNLNQRHKVMILSNTNSWHVSHLRKHHKWAFEFHDFVASCEVKLLKPDPEIYHLTLKRVNAKPEETFYTDDRPENIKAAKKLGIDAVIFKGYDSFLKEVKKRNLIPS